VEPATPGIGDTSHAVNTSSIGVDKVMALPPILPPKFLVRLVGRQQEVLVLFGFAAMRFEPSGSRHCTS